MRLQSMARKTSLSRRKESCMNSYNSHLISMQIERSEYCRIRRLAGEESDSVLSVIFDVADQAQFALPRFCQKSKRDTGQALKQKVTGVLFHRALEGLDFSQCSRLSNIFCPVQTRQYMPSVDS